MAFEYAVALTGSIATGKSTVAQYFKTNGFCIIDADKIAHTILDEQYVAIQAQFGKDCIIGQKVNRKELGKIIFKQRDKKVLLESMLHPLIFDKIEGLARKEDMKKRPYFVDIPLFYENERYTISKQLVVYTPKKKQLKRLMQRDGYTLEEALLRIDSQIDIEEKRKRATYLIDNSGDLRQLMHECERVKEEILGDFR